MIWKKYGRPVKGEGNWPTKKLKKKLFFPICQKQELTLKQHDEMIKSWVRLVRDPRTSPDILEKAAYWESLNTPDEFEIRFWVASNPNCESAILGTLSLVKNLRVLIQVAGHRRLREETAGKLLKSHLRQLRKSLASNSSIPLGVMQKLSRDYEDVRECLARNPGIPPEIIKKLAHEKNPKIRASLAKNPRLSLSAFKFLKNDPHVRVRTSLLANIGLPYEILHAMAEDPEEQVRAMCMARAIDECPNDLSIFQKLSEFKDSETGRNATNYMATYKEKKENGQEEGEAETPED